MLSEDRRINSKEQLKEWLDVELKRYRLTPRRILPYLFQISEGAILHKHTILLRKTEYYINTGKKLRAKLYYARLTKMQMRYGVHIPVNTCGKGLVIPHVLPLALNGEVTVGENCTICPNAYLAYGAGSNTGVPTLGDNVTVGIGAIVVGGITIADGVNIGAGAVVTKSFLEPGISIAGVPARKLGEKKQEEKQ